jgi:hypothetical protein
MGLRASCPTKLIGVLRILIFNAEDLFGELSDFRLHHLLVRRLAGCFHIATAAVLEGDD